MPNTRQPELPGLAPAGPAAPRSPTPAAPATPAKPAPHLGSTHWITYTDGACAPSNPGPAGWGVVVLPPGGHPVHAHYGFIGPGTNQIAELTAAIEGLSRVPEGVLVELVSDSQYVLKGISEWRAGWERKGWRNAAGQPVANKGLWQRLFALADARTVRTRWVRGHAGDHYNERADQLANTALRLKAGGTA